MSEENLDMLVCTKTSASRPIYGSVRAACANCDAPVWVSQSGQKALKERETLKIFCVECAQSKVQNTDEEIKAEIVPGAIDEIKRILMKIEEN